MHTELTHLSQVRKRLTVAVPASDVAAAIDQLLRRRRQTVQMPGFRPGKAPLELVRARLGRALAHDAAEALVEEFGRSALRQEGLQPLWFDVELPEGQERLPDAEAGREYRFVLLVEVRPTIEPKDYVGQTIGRPKVEVEVEDVQRELEGLRQAHGKLVDVSDRASGPGDFVGVEIEGVELGGDAKLPKESRAIRLGDERNLPEFERGLAGRRPGDEFAFEVTYPSETPSPQLAGRVITFSGAVKAVKRLDAPEWSDDLARASVPGVAGFADLREQLKESIRLRKEREADQVARRRLLDKLCDANPFEAPPILVEQELRERLQRIGQRLAAQGVDLDKVEIDWEKAIAAERLHAERAVREGLLLDAIADRQPAEVKVEPEDVDRVVAAMAQEANQPVRALQATLQQQGRIESLRREIRRSKCLDWLYAKAHIS